MKYVFLQVFVILHQLTGCFLTKHYVVITLNNNSTSNCHFNTIIIILDMSVMLIFLFLNTRFHSFNLCQKCVAGVLSHDIIVVKSRTRI